jgi:hypothetical protein
MEPSFIEYLIKQTLLRPDRMIEAFWILLAVMVLLILVAIFRRPKRHPLPVFHMPESSSANAPPVVRKDLFSQSIPTRSAQAGSHMNMAELLDIEEALLALRELYHRKLISANVYVDESMKHSARLMR